MRKFLAFLCLGFGLLLFSGAKASDLSPCPGSYNSITWHNCFGTYTRSNGIKYVGEWRDGQGHGQGAYTFANGATYVGEIMLGQPYKYGDRPHPDDEDPNIEKNRFLIQGSGRVFLVADRRFAAVIWIQIYVGDAEMRQLRGGYPRIFGTYRFANGGEYSGEIIYERPYGKGILTLPDGDKHVGEFLVARFHGQGTLTLVDGTVKEGFWENGCLRDFCR